MSLFLWPFPLLHLDTRLLGCLNQFHQYLLSEERLQFLAIRGLRARREKRYETRSVFQHIHSGARTNHTSGTLLLLQPFPQRLNATRFAKRLGVEGE